ncbi:hypothetical protein THMIRHAM_18290 [Thiomicrorhabdus immobilis]|uniref:Cytochrome c domain-containing protein n=1 Tax=Thiomicrorhabdus immobilis TaxID=2791037 RepID=A0ABN6CZJ7_9GAMM|nr:cytochrome c peroxidase [Thiomicrorhabdus immobilis]BCN94044.1 hypothetical protein THMIRHAM_18290 [Thiomicrorhabdus immobilis]
MKRQPHLFFILFFVIALTGYFAFNENSKADGKQPTYISQEFEILEKQQTENLIQPIPESLPLNSQKVILGEKLFADKNLSATKTISCSSCHNLALGGTDQKAVSTGIHNRLGTINAPTVFNSGFNFVQFWDGRAPDLATQAVSPLFNENEMGNTNWESIISYLNKDNEYRTLFQNAYASPATPKALLDSLSEYQKSLITPNSKLDQYLKGDHSALNTLELEGYQLFINRGCISCHQGINMGGNLYQKAGVFKELSTTKTGDWDGRYKITKNIQDKGVFKVPSLRNIELTAPYFHDGSAKTLKAAVESMAKSQLGTELTEQESYKIVTFLKALTGEYKKHPL